MSEQIKDFSKQREQAADILESLRNKNISYVRAQAQLTELGCQLHTNFKDHEMVHEYFEDAFSKWAPDPQENSYLISESSSGSMLRFFDDPENDEEHPKVLTLAQECSITLELIIPEGSPYKSEADIHEWALNQFQGPTLLDMIIINIDVVAVKAKIQS